MIIPYLNNKDEQGSVLIVALLILVLLTVIGISAISTTNIETQISGNEKFHKIAFYNTDAGIFPTAKVVSAIVDDQSEEIGWGEITYLDNNGVPDGSLFNEVMGYADDGGTEDIQMEIDNYPVKVDIDRTGAKNVSGGGVEFASGAEGIGAGSSGGVAVYYNLDSTGDGPANSEANIAADYRKVIGVPGGL